MNIVLKINNKIRLKTIREFNPELENITGLLWLLCEEIYENHDCYFNISGFGQKKWPVDDYGELVCYLEMLPYGIKSLSKGDEFMINFHDQGVERKLVFKLIDKYNWEIECFANYYYGFEPKPSKIIMKANIISDMFKSNLNEFLDYIKPLNIGTWKDVFLDWENGNYYNN